MKIIFLTPGTGSYYCGACMRDNALARELYRSGHDVTLAPMYLPMMLDDETPAEVRRAPIFFGGINVYLQQKVALFRKTPALIDRLFNRDGLLRWAARHSHMTSAREHGEMTLEMLRVENSRFRKEWDKLLDWLAHETPDLICLSNALLAGFAAELKRQLHAPVITFFQGEDSFLDGLPEPYRTQCWTALGQRLADSDLLLAPSRFYAELMRERLGLPPGSIDVVPNGIRLDDYAPAGARPSSPVIGYLARMNRDKGLEVLVDAFIQIAGEVRDVRLKIGGAATAGDEPFVAAMKQRIAAAGLADRVEWAPNLTREGKIAFLRSLTLFSVPAVYAEAFGLYLIEAMACGVPVVQPDASAFPEIIELTGGGLCVEPRNPSALAAGWRQLLGDETRRTALGRAARLGVEKYFGAKTMCAQFLAACRVTPHAQKIS
ncbi:MAG: glycosyltransferase family 4 protein [Opitutaceae bacterium]|nr:glycosyltransferase family 4 protein [Opitutaceae bacterium]